MFALIFPTQVSTSMGHYYSRSTWQADTMNANIAYCALQDEYPEICQREKMADPSVTHSNDCH